MFLLFLSVAYGFLERLTPKNSFTASTYIVSDPNTVHFVQTELRELLGSSFSNHPPDYIKTTMTVYRGDPNAGGTLLYDDIKASDTNTFFFTTPFKDHYHIIFSATTEDGHPPAEHSLGIDTKIYSGEANRPGIVSNNDVEVSKAESLIERVLSFVKQNIKVQETEEEGVTKSKALYEGIMKKVLFVLLLKICATGLTMYYSSRKTKSFYASQGFVADK